MTAFNLASVNLGSTLVTSRPGLCTSVRYKEQLLAFHEELQSCEAELKVASTPTLEEPGCCTTLSHTMYQSTGFRKSAPPQNRQFNVSIRKQ